MVHQTSTERYVQANRDLWQVRCEQCGLIGRDVTRFEDVERVESVHLTVSSSLLVP